MVHYKVVLKDEPMHETRDEVLLKSKTYYFVDDWKTARDKFIEENKERGYEIEKSDLVCYGYGLSKDT